MQPGKYRLACDVKNPDGDARTRRDWRKQPILAAGTLFYCQREQVADTAHDVLIISEAHAYAHQFIFEGRRAKSKLWVALVPHLERIGDEDHMLRDSEKITLLVDTLKQCPHGCTDGNCPFDRKMRAILKQLGEL